MLKHATPTVVLVHVCSQTQNKGAICCLLVSTVSLTGLVDYDLVVVNVPNANASVFYPNDTALLHSISLLNPDRTKVLTFTNSNEKPLIVSSVIKFQDTVLESVSFG